MLGQLKPGENVALPPEGCEGVLVVAGGDSSPLLQPPESAFDGVALGVAGGVETGWAAAFGSSTSPVFALVGAFWDGVGHPSATQLVAGRGVRVGLVGQQPDSVL